MEIDSINGYNNINRQSSVTIPYVRNSKKESNHKKSNLKANNLKSKKEHKNKNTSYDLDDETQKALQVEEPCSSYSIMVAFKNYFIFFEKKKK